MVMKFQRWKPGALAGMCVLRHVAGGPAWGPRYLIQRPWSWRGGVDGGWGIVGVDWVEVWGCVVEKRRLGALFAVWGHCHICVCRVVGQVERFVFGVVAPVQTA